MCITTEDRVAIYIDEDVIENQEGRYRFTLAEEYAHSVLHAELFRDVHSLDDSIRLHQSLTGEEIWLMDRHARYLAACILIPASQVLEFAQNLVPPQLDPVAHLIAEVRDEELFSTAARILHSFYRVSEICMRYRIANQAVRLDKWLLQRYRSHSSG